MSSFDELRKQMKEKYGSAGKTGTASQNGTVSNDKTTFSQLRAEMRSKYGGGVVTALQEDTDKVNSWIERYNTVVTGVSEYNTRRNGGYTTDVSGGYSGDIDSLIQEYDTVRKLNGGQYLKSAYDQLTELRDSIRSENSYMGLFSGAGEYFAVKQQQEETEKRRGTTRQVSEVEQELNSVNAQLTALYGEQNSQNLNNALSAAISNFYASSSGFATPVERAPTPSGVAKLEQKKKLLEEELGWAQYFAQEQANANDAAWTEKYAGKSYNQLQRTLNLMTKGTDEYEWLSQYAPTVMTAEDKQQKINQNANEIYLLEAVLEEYNRSVDLSSEAGILAAAAKEKQLQTQYGSRKDILSRIEELKLENWKLGNEIEYSYLSQNEDFADKSGYVSTKDTDGKAWWQHKTDYGDLTYEYINNQGAARDDISKFITSTESNENALLTYRKYENMTADEVAAYNYLYASKGKQAAEEYLEYLSYALNERQREKEKQTAADMSQGFWGGTASSVLSVPLNLMSGVGLLDAGMQKLSKNLQEAVTGEYAGPVDYNTDAMSASVAASTIRNTVSGNIAKATGTIKLSEQQHPYLARILNGKSLGDAYQLGMSMLDSMAVAALSPVIGSAGTALLGGSAGTQGMLDAVANGATDEQALTMGILNGAFEMLFEKYELESLLKSDSRMLRSIAFQALNEGVGETGTSLANLMADTIVMAEKSNWQQGINSYMESGLSEAEARKQAFWDVAIQTAWDFIGGALMGGIMGGGTSAIAKHQESRAEKAYEQFIQALADAEKGNSQTTGNPNADTLDPSVTADTVPAPLTQESQERVEVGDTAQDEALPMDIQSQIERSMRWPGEETQAVTQENTYDPERDSIQAQVERNLGIRQTDTVTADGNGGVSLENVDITAPVSVAEQIRQQRAAAQQTEGGVNNVQTTEGADTAQPVTDAGGGVLYGSSQRNDGTRSGEQTGELAGSAEQAAQRKADASRRFAGVQYRQNLAKSLRLPRVSTSSLGITNGTDNPAVYVLPQENWDTELQNTASRIAQETGKQVCFVVGRLQVKGGKARGATVGEHIFVQADDIRYTPDQIADHEAFHVKRDLAYDHYHINIVRQLREKLAETYTPAQMKKILYKYVDAMEGYLDPRKATSQEESDAIMEQIMEELLADAYAGINAFGAGATEFTDEVNRYMTDHGMGKEQSQENGTAQTTGPPEARLSFEPETEEKEILSFSDEIQRQVEENWGIRPKQSDSTTAKDAYVDKSASGGYDFTKSFEEQLKDYEEGKFPQKDTFLLGKTPDILTKIGLAQLPMTMDREHVSYALEGNYKGSSERVKDHLMDKEELAGIVDLISDPVAIIQDKQLWQKNAREYSVDVLIEKTINGKKALVPININSIGWINGERIDSNRVQTVHGNEDTIQRLVNAINEDSDDNVALFYINKEKAADFLRHAGNPISRAAQELDGFIHSVTDPGSNVKMRIHSVTESRQFKEWFGDWQNHPEDASKVVNADGTPKVVYHGTNKNFTVFQSEDGCYWFSENEDYAESMAEERGSKIVMKAYLNMRRPYRTKLAPGQFSDPGYEAPIIRAAQAGNYDGVIIEVDTNNELEMDTFYVVFDPTQIKSATDNIGTFDGGNQDIRYSWAGEEEVQETGVTEQATKELMEAIQSMSGKDIMNDQKLRSIIAQYTQDTTPAPKPQTYKVDRANLKKAITSELGLTKDQTEHLTGILNRYADTGKPPRRETRKAKTDPKVDTDIQVKATTSIRNLKHSLRSMFSIPAGSRAEINSYIDRFAQRIIANEKLTHEDRQEFFRTMYEAGMMEVEADAIYAEGRSYMTSGRIYVNESLRRSLGDRWNELRQRAFAAGVYLTTDPNNGAGVDVWNQDLARQVPGLFDVNETDMEVALERLIQVAEEGRSERVSLPEYIAQLAKQEHIPVSEILDTMEQQMDYALRVFSESVGVELEIKKETERQKAKERQAHREAAERAKNARELREAKRKALSALKWLAKNRKKAPRDLRGKIDEILGDIDVMAMSAAKATNWDVRYGDTWRNLVNIYKSVKDENSPNYDPNFTPSQHLENMMMRLDGMHLSDMEPDVNTIRELYNAAVDLQTEIQNRNVLLEAEQHRQIGEVFRSVRKEIQEGGTEESDHWWQKLFQEKQLNPMNVMQRMVGWKPDSVFMEIAKQIENGIRDVRRYMVDSNRMLADFIKDNERWLKTADGQGKDGVWYDIEIPELKSWNFRDGAIYGETVTISMTPLQKIHLYLESQSNANLDHIKSENGGRVFADKEIYRKGDRKKAFDKGVTVKLSPVTVRKITSDLTEEEMALAKILERYYNQYAPEKINAMSNIIYGYDIATEGFYTPIWVNKDFVQKDIGRAEDSKAISAGSMQARIHGKNPTYNVSCIEAVEKHIRETAYAVGMAIPTNNWNKLLKYAPYQEEGSLDNLRVIISRVYGRSGLDYIDNLLTELQSEYKKGPKNWLEGLAQKLQSLTIGATFATNPKIAVKQYGSVPLAAPYLGSKYFPKPNQLRVDRQLIDKYSPVLAWRTMGYSMPETKQFKDNPNWTQTNKFFRFAFGGDHITATDGSATSILWPWAENKVRDLYPKLEVGTQEQIDAGESPFYKKVAEEFEYAVTRSQSTSEDIYQSELRKEQSALAKTVTMFRSDSAQTYNAFRQKFGEAMYYKKHGTKEQQKAAKRAVGSVVAATTFNALWSAIVGDFLLDLWKNAAKYWRDDEDELTWGSVLSELGWKVFGTFAGVVTGGDLIADVLGALVTGESGWDIEAPGVEQLNDIRKLVEEQGGKLKGLFSDVSELAKYDGNVWKYLGDHAGEFAQILYDVALEIATLWGVPLKNTADYFVKPIIRLIPGAQSALEDLLKQPEKADLSGLEGAALESRLENVLAGRNVEVSEDSLEALSALYTAGMTGAIPSATPDSVSIDEVERTLGIHQQQTYDFIWGDIVSGALDDVISSEQFASADDETKQKMLKRLYDYASAQARSVLFPEYVKKTGILNTENIIKAGASVADAILWESEIAEMKQPEKFDALLDHPWSDSVKQAVIGTLMDNELETESGNPTEYAKFLELIEEGMSAEQYLQIRLSDVNTDTALEMAEGGLDGEDIVEYAEMLGDVDLEPGEDSATELQKWRACVDLSTMKDIQLAALCGTMTESQFQKVQIAYNFDVSPDQYVSFYEIKDQFNEDGKGNLKNDEVTAAIDSLGGSYTTEQKAVLWQLATGSTSAKNNPYSQSVGQEVIDAREAAKEKAEEE